jgi:ABC-2 type transport system ATP-binding protein
VTWGLESASVRFGTRTALNRVTLRAEPSTVSVVVGGDGAGKSTLLRALVGLVPLCSGLVRRPSKNEIGYVPATAGLYVDLTVGENLAFAGGAYGARGAELIKRSSDILERIGLSDARARLGGQLSGGMQRKLAVGMALLHRPALLVLDEPTTGVDPVSRAELWRLISAAAAEGTAVVATTTYVDEAQRASMVMLLEQGRSIATGSCSEIVAAIPGRLGVVRSTAQPQGLSWRWGTTWRVWAPSNDLPEGAEPLQPGFEDAVIVASLSDEQKVWRDARAR